MDYFINKFPVKLLFSKAKMGILFLLFLTTSVVYAQEKTVPIVKGVVKMMLAKFAGASISIRGSKTFATSKADGSFVLKMYLKVR
jgi:hypothetical protein